MISETEIEHALLIRDIAAMADPYQQSASTGMKFINRIANHKNPFRSEDKWSGDTVGKGSAIVLKIKREYPNLWARVEEYLISEGFK